ncbi:hypothetical protein WICPIJ_007019 [Wickerhamomyces pijperi]|uniref:Uncharacterized protein n=1 Tax=Wickerhamomyces pijperi TaxID=599730 RepID=A0A9P8Q1C8_WICPI|nr:hypothetical protein WICPIJ_007019 [Wickerhamomyces pijperi]
MNGVETHQRGDEKTHPFNRTDTSNRDTGKGIPNVPSSGEFLPGLVQVMDLDKSEERSSGEEQQSGVQKNELTQGDIRALQTNHHSDQMNTDKTQSQSVSSPVSDRDNSQTEESVQHSDSDKVQSFWVCLPRFKSKIFTIPSGKIFSKTNNHLT